MKKLLAVFFVFVFVLSLGAAPAHAQGQAQATSFAYIPLVDPAAQTTLPLALQARHAYLRVAPQLARAQAQGQVVRFAPNLQYGFVKVEYRTGFNLAAALQSKSGAEGTVYDSPAPILASAPVKDSLQSMQPQSATPMLYMTVYDDCFNMRFMTPADGFYRLYLSNTFSTIVGYSEGDLASGNAEGCVYGYWANANPGYSVDLYIYNNAHTEMMASYHAVVPNLAINTINISKKTVTGIAPASSDLEVLLEHYLLDGSGDITHTIVNTTSTSKGTWSANFSGHDMRGGDYLGVAYLSGNVAFARYLDAPYVACSVQGDYCQSTGQPFKAAKLSIKHGKTTYKLSGTFDAWGRFGGLVVDKSGNGVIMQAGDHITGTGIKAFTLPDLTANVWYDYDIIQGTAPANQAVEVDLTQCLVPIFMCAAFDFSTVTDASGIYTADFSGSTDIQSTDLIETYTGYADPITGNSAYFDGFWPPYYP